MTRDALSEGTAWVKRERRSAEGRPAHQLEGERARDLRDLGAIAAEHILDEGLRLIGADQVEGASAKPAADHPTAEASGMILGEGDQEIELRTADLIVIAEALVRFQQDGPQLDGIPCRDGLHRASHARILGADVTKPPGRDVISGEHRGRDIPHRVYGGVRTPHRRQTVCTLAHAVLVRTGCKLSTHPAVEHHPRHLVERDVDGCDLKL